MVVSVQLDRIPLPLPLLPLLAFVVAPAALVMLVLLPLILLTLRVFYSSNSPPVLLRGTIVYPTADYRLCAPRASYVDGQQSVSSAVTGAVVPAVSVHASLHALMFSCLSVVLIIR